MADITIEVAGRKFSPEEFDEDKFGPKEAGEITVEFSCPYCGYDNSFDNHHYLPNDYKHICDSCGGPIPITEDVFPSDMAFIPPRNMDYLKNHLTALEGFTDVPESPILRLYVKYQMYLKVTILTSMVGIIVASFFGLPNLIGGVLLAGLLIGSLVLSYLTERQFRKNWESPPVTFKMLSREPYKSLYLYQSTKTDSDEEEAQDISPSRL